MDLEINDQIQFVLCRACIHRHSDRAGGQILEVGMTTPAQCSSWWDAILKRDFAVEAHSIVRGTHTGRVTRFHVLALAYEIEELREEIRQLQGVSK